ncbi:MAG: pantoate--beta-alanine ligase [Deltaproteobacteria bacterium]|nr:pantoate--beta-alanine ligase [Deltaproteobacteria bacterium]
MKVIQKAQEMHDWAKAQIKQRARIALVPTMGYLHEGHLSLVAIARANADLVIASIFINPTQFSPNEDFAQYPRDLKGDLQKLEVAGVDVVFTPNEGEMYPPGFATYIVPTDLANVLCGISRPHHFRGVCTIVHLLFRMTKAHVAVFGEKDYQQLTIIRRMVCDLWLDVEIIGGPTVREVDGLAKSSRNTYLSADERLDALILFKTLNQIEATFKTGERRVEKLLEQARKNISTVASARIDYIEIVSADDLVKLNIIDRKAICAMAVFIGKTRLIDNRALV